MSDADVLDTTATDTTKTDAVVDTTKTVVDATRSGISDPWAKDWIQPDFTLNHKALERLPDHLKPLRATLERQKSFDDVLTAMHTTQSLAGKKALAPLPADSPAPVLAERKALLDQINGVPATPKDYGVVRPNEIPESQWNPKLAEGFSNWAHKNSIAPTAMKELLNMQLGTVKEQLAAQANYEKGYWANEQKTFEATVQTQNMPIDKANALVQKGVVALGLDPENAQTKIFLQGATARLMAMKHAIAIGEDHVVTGEGGDANKGQDHAAMAKDIQSNPQNPLHAQYWNKEGKFSASTQAAAAERVNELYRLAAAKAKPRDARHS